MTLKWRSKRAPQCCASALPSLASVIRVRRLWVHRNIMIIIGRLYWFANWAVIAAIMAVIALILLRLLANYADLNPFGWPSLTIRRLTDPFIGPVRRALIRFGIDPKYSPLVVILITILLGWFVLQLVQTLATTFAGLFTSIQRGALGSALGFILYGL